jgi:hypothetical protein
MTSDQDHELCGSFCECDPPAITTPLAQAHADALLDNLPCEICGHRELHPNHRGIGHTHTPAEDPLGRAHALIALVNTAALVVPPHVFETALMIVGSANDPADVVGREFAAATLEDLRRFLADPMRYGKAADTCTGCAEDHDPIDCPYRLDRRGIDTHLADPQPTSGGPMTPQPADTEPGWLAALQQEMAAKMKAVRRENGIRGGDVTAGLFTEAATDVAASFIRSLKSEPYAITPTVRGYLALAAANARTAGEDTATTTTLDAIARLGIEF